MFSIVPDKLLEASLCSICDKYLSVLPVTLLPDGKFKCGRCVVGNVAVQTKYNKLAEGMLFKCVNRYEGCRKLLLPNQVVGHEEVCKSNLYDCPLCAAKQMSGYTMKRHFEKHHAKSVINKPEFKVDTQLDTHKTHMYCTDRHIFFIHASMDVDKKLFLKANCLGPKQESKNIRCKFRTSKIIEETPLREFQGNEQELHVEYEKALINCELILNYEMDTSLNTIQIENDLSQNNIRWTDYYIIPKIRIISVDKYFFAKHVEWELSTCKTLLIHKYNPKLTLCSFCSSCGFLLIGGCFICKCSEKHILCLRCHFKPIKCCPNLKEYTILEKNIENVFNELKFLCKWKCQNAFRCGKLNEHELNCTQRDSINCLFCSESQIPNANALETHFSTHNKLHILKDNIIQLNNEIVSNLFGSETIYFYMDDLSEYVILQCEGNNGNVNCTLKTSNFTNSNLYFYLKLDDNGFILREKHFKYTSNNRWIVLYIFREVF